MNPKNQGADFLWGAATSSYQIEGGAKHSDWWAWEAKGHVDGGARCGLAADHIHRFKEDLKLAKDLGLNSYRFSFEWSRIEPKEGEWSEEAFLWYEGLVSECERLGLVPMATLHHFTLPQWLAEQGGFANDESPEKFAVFTRKITERLGSRIPLWCTINEPMVLVSGAYLGKFMPPGDFNPKGATAACFNLLKSHVLAYDILKKEITRREGPFRSLPLEVGFAHNMIDFLAERRFHPIERFLSKAFARVYNDSWLQAVNGEKQRFGFVGLFKAPPQLFEARGRKTFDFIGINYYTKGYVQWRPRTQAKERDSKVPIGLSFAKRKELASDLGWAVHPKGFRRMLESLRRFQAPIYVTENGIADATDGLRESYMASHLREVAIARERGLDIRGYYYWSLIDNFEWIKGFWPRFGLAHVDYETFERTPRLSATFYREVIRAHGGTRGPEVETLRTLTSKRLTEN